MAKFTEKQILDRLNFHETQHEYFARNGQVSMAKWANETAEEWRAKLAGLPPTPPNPRKSSLDWAMAILAEGADGD